MKIATSIFILLLVCAPWPAGAAYPDRETTVYCGSSAGGTTDVSIRILSDIVSKEFGQPVVVVNKAGASHTVCANLVANAKPDGYTLGPCRRRLSRKFPTSGKSRTTSCRILPGSPPTPNIPAGWSSNRTPPGKRSRNFWITVRKTPGKLPTPATAMEPGGIF